MSTAALPLEAENLNVWVEFRNWELLGFFVTSKSWAWVGKLGPFSLKVSRYGSRFFAVDESEWWE